MKLTLPAAEVCSLKMNPMRTSWLCCRHIFAGFLILLIWPRILFAGGGPFNTLVVVNTNSADSVELGDYYAVAHGIPDHQICRLGITANLTSVTSNEFKSWLLDPITNHIATHGLLGQIDFLVLCQDFPTRVRNVEGVSASLFYGFKNAPSYWEAGKCNLPDYTSNAFFRAERAFRSVDGWNSTNGFVAFHLLAANLATAKLVVDRGAAAQSTFPSATFYLYNLGDEYRGIRESWFANTQFSFTALPGLSASCSYAPLYDIMSGKTNVMGYHDGFSNVQAPLLNDLRTNNVWLPGAYADHLTSSGGMISNFTNETGQSTVLDWMQIGATASYGTVAEPCNYLEKFPDPIMGFYYARGFSIGEAYAMSVEAPYQGLFVGDPLAAPFAAPPVLAVTSQVPYQIVTGTIPVQVSAAARSNGVPAAAIDLYLDGRFHTNLATLGPTEKNRLSIVVEGRTNTATVATNDSLFDVVVALADAVNDDTNQIVSAKGTGDRLELIYNGFNHDGDNVLVSASVSTGTASSLTLGVGLAATHLTPSTYPARKQLLLTANPYSAGANTGDTVTCTITLTNGVAITNQLVASQGESVINLLERLRSAISNNATLQATNGVRYERLSRDPSWESGTLFARTPGPDGWGIQVDYIVNPVSATNGLTTNVNFSSFMDDFPDDIRPRASILFHVTPTNGILEATASVDTTTLSDGVHTLDFIARDGSAVAAQSRLTLPLVVANTSCVLTVASAYGTSTPLVGIHLYSPGDLLTNSVAAPPDVGGTQIAGSGWSLIGNDPTTGSLTNFTMAITNNAALTWLWTTNYWLDTEASEHGSINVADVWQPANATTQITASAEPYFHFTSWTGSASSTNNPLDLLMNAPKSIQANFAENLATNKTPEWWLAQYGWTNDFDAAATNDSDDDGYFTWQEYIADTIPTNAESFFPPLGATGFVTNLQIVIDPTSTGRQYHVDVGTPITNPGWTDLTNAAGTGSAWSPEIIPPSTGMYFYRGRVTLSP